MLDSFCSRTVFLTALVAACVILSAAAPGQHSAGPQPLPPPPPIAAPADTPYPGTISLRVDTSNVTARIFQVQMHPSVEMTL